MSDVDAASNRAQPLQAVKKYWSLSLVICLVFMVAGIVAGRSRAPVYTAEVRLAIGGQNLTAYSIGSYAVAAQELAADYARYVSLPEDGDALKTALGARADQVAGLSASPVPNSSIISVVAQAKDQGVAKVAATAAGNTLLKAVNTKTSDQVAASLLAQYNALSTQVAQANQTLQAAQATLAKLTAASTTSPSALAGAQQAEAAASTKYSALQLQQSAVGNHYQSVVADDSPSSNLVVVQPAAIISSNRMKNAELVGLVGLAVGVVVAMLLSTFLMRQPLRRLWRMIRSRPTRTSRLQLSANDDDAGGLASAGRNHKRETVSR